MSVWSNDSGSGFEHTKSLYVGRNGGAYMIREWKSDAEIARAAADNILRYYRVLRDAARRINPRFRVITRLESFYGEREPLWPGLRDGIDVEVNSSRRLGEHSPSPYPDIPVLGSISQHMSRRREGRRSSGATAGLLFIFSTRTGITTVTFLSWLTRQAPGRPAGISAGPYGGLQPPDGFPRSTRRSSAPSSRRGLDIDAACSRSPAASPVRATRPPSSGAGGRSKRPSGNSFPCLSTPDSGRSGTGSSSGRSFRTSAGSRPPSGPITKR
jgi:hypothetical protein